MPDFADPETLTASERETGTVFAPRFDASGLVTAITVDAQSREVLMVAHMNAEALEKTIVTGFAHYYSRSRKTLWKKGESSGELQQVVEIRTDCDQDAVLLSVHQAGRGAACHTGRPSCFYRQVVLADGQPALVDTGAPVLFDPADVYGKS